jgi:hypothetical protein
MSRTATIVDWAFMAQKRGLSLREIRQFGILYTRVHAALGMINATHAPEWAREGAEELKAISKLLAVQWQDDPRVIRVNAGDCLNEIRLRLTGYSYDYAIHDDEENAP